MKILNYKIFPRIFILFFGLTTLCCCASFPKKNSIKTSNSINSFKNLNGRYYVNAIKQDSINVNYLYENFYSRVNRNHKIDDTLMMKSIKNSYFELEVLDNNKLKIDFFKDGEIFDSYSLKTELKNDGYLYIKNKNLKTWGIPFLFGYFDVQKMRLSLNSSGSLLSEFAEQSAGGFFIIVYPNWKTWNFEYTYERIK